MSSSSSSSSVASAQAFKWWNSLSSLDREQILNYLFKNSPETLLAEVPLTVHTLHLKNKEFWK